MILSILFLYIFKKEYDISWFVMKIILIILIKTSFIINISIENGNISFILNDVFKFWIHCKVINLKKNSKNSSVNKNKKMKWKTKIISFLLMYSTKKNLDKVTVCLIGDTGMGKSSFGNLYLQKNVFEAND